MRRLIHYIIMVVLCVQGLAVLGQPNNKINFIPNNGQWNANIKYRANLFGGVVFCEGDKLRFVLSDVDELKQYKGFVHRTKGIVPYNGKLKMHAYTVDFVNANLSNIKAFYPEKDYVNYYLGNNPKQWARNVNKYRMLVYDNVYDGVDLELMQDGFGLKYNFIVAPNAASSAIRLEYNGVDKLQIDNDNLVVRTSVNTIVEEKPFAYQLLRNDTVVVRCNYRLEGNVLSFDFPDGYNSNYPLVIDPRLVFASYSESTADNWGNTATYDKEGFLYSGGVAFDIGYNTTVGAYQLDYGGGIMDMAITKYDKSGESMVYSSYIGGDRFEVPHSLIVNNKNELVIYGTSGSNNYPCTLNAYDNTFNGGNFYKLYGQYTVNSDLVITILNSDGTDLVASTYFGGSKNDGINSDNELNYNYADEIRGEVEIDKNNNIYIATTTESEDIPVTSNVFQTAYNGKHEGLIIKFDATLSNLIWCSYLGGSGADAIYSLELDDNDDIYVAGGTNSIDLNIAKNGIQPDNKGGIAEGFVAKIRKTGTAIDYFTYYGSNNYDQIYFVSLDKDNNVYVSGQTKADAATFIKDAAWNYPGGGMFISKFNPQLSQVLWSTEWGDNTNSLPDISLSAMTVDLCGRVFLTGWGGDLTNNGRIGSTENLPITNDAAQKTTDGYDYYLMQLSADASDLIYATFLGGDLSQEHVDGGTSRFDKAGIVYQSVCAGCGGNSDFPTTTQLNQNLSSNCNNAVFKLDMELNVVVADFANPSIGCAPYLVKFENKSVNGKSFHWEFGDGTSSTLLNPSHTYSEKGQYTIRLIASSDVACNYADTISKTILILSNEEDTLEQKIICDGNPVQIGLLPYSDTLVKYLWSPGKGLSDSTVSNPIANPSVTTNYELSISNGLCSSKVNQLVEVIDLKVSAGADTVVCNASHLLVADAKGNASEFIWSDKADFSHRLNSELTDSVADVVLADGENRFYVKASYEYCSDIDTVDVFYRKAQVHIRPINRLCLFDTVLLEAINDNPSDVLKYKWSPASLILSNDTLASVNVTANEDAWIYLSSQNQWGCNDHDSILLRLSLIEASINAFHHINCNHDCDGWAKVDVDGNEPFEYKWNDMQTTDSAINLCNGWHFVTVTDQYGCKDIDSVEILKFENIDLALVDKKVMVCDGLCEGYLEIAVKGGMEPYRILWNNGDTTKRLINLCSADYGVTITDDNDCILDSVFQVRDTSGFYVDVEAYNDELCYKACNGVLSLLPHGAAPYHYQWNDVVDDVSARNDLCSGKYDVIVKDNYNCVFQVFKEIKKADSLYTDVQRDIWLNCYADTTNVVPINTFGGMPPYVYLLNTDTLSGALSGLAAGNYILTTIDAHDCRVVDTISVRQPDALTLTYIISPSACVEACNGKIETSISGGVPPYTFNWDAKIDTLQLDSLCGGNYDLDVSDSKGCRIDSAFYVDHKTPQLDIVIRSAKDTIYKGQSTVIHVIPQEGYDYSWTPEETIDNPFLPKITVTPSVSTDYRVYLTDSAGCVFEKDKHIEVKEVICNEPYIYVPNAFTPNADNENDVLYVRSNMIKALTWSVYDRWGEKVFETTNVNEGWDGRYKNKALSPAVFVYQLDVVCYDNATFSKKGNITLLK